MIVACKKRPEVVARVERETDDLYWVRFPNDNSVGLPGDELIPVRKIAWEEKEVRDGSRS